MTQDIIHSVFISTIDRWTNELESRVIFDNAQIIRECKKIHTEDTASDLDKIKWEKIHLLRQELMKSSCSKLSILGSIRASLHRGDYQTASDLHIMMDDKVDQLRNKYIEYKQNLFEV